MKKLWVLSRVGLQTLLLGISGGAKGKKRKARSALGSLLIIAFVGLYISGVYSYTMLEVLSPIHMEVLLFMIMGIAALISGILFTAMSVKNTLFDGQDNDLLLSMPVGTGTLALSRVLAIYLESLLFTFFMLVPAGVACTLLSQAGVGRTFDFWVRLLIIVFALPLLDTALSVLLGGAVAWISSKVGKGNITQTLVMGLYLAVLMWFSFSISERIESLALNAANVYQKLGWIAPIAWMGNGIMESWGDVARFALMCILAFAILSVLMGLTFRKLVSAFAARSARSDYRLTRQHSKGATKALMGKELRRLFGTPIWFWNAVLGFIMLLAAGVMLNVKKGDLNTLASVLPSRWLLVIISMAVVVFCLSTCLLAAPSVSLEGKSLWLLRTAPVSGKRILGIKTGVQMLLGLPVVLLFGVMLAISGIFNIPEALIVTAFGFTFEAGHACFGMLMGLTFPRLDAPNEASVVKQGVLPLTSMFVPMAVIGAGALIGWALFKAGVWQLYSGIIIGMATASVLLSVLCCLKLWQNGEKLLNRLSE